MGRCLRSLDREDEAEVVLSEARRVLEPLGARPALDEIDELLRVPARGSGA